MEVQTPPLAPAVRTADQPDDLSRRTWELELLISGAVVFALMQLPGEIEAFYRSALPHAVGGSRSALCYGHMYAKVSVYALILRFLLHLAARAYWIGLIGLRSVYPSGIRWDNTGQGPITVRVFRERLPSLDAMIMRAHRFCSVIFSFAFLVVAMCVMSILGTALLGGTAFVLSHLLFGGERMDMLFWIILAVAAAVPMLAKMVDRRYGERLDPAGRPARMVHGTMRWVHRSLSGVYAPVLLTLFSNIPKKIISPLFHTVFFGLIATVFLELFTREGIIRVNSYAYIPAVASEHSVDYHHCEDQVAPGEYDHRMPTIPSDVVRGPYLRLFVPYSPRRHNAALEPDFRFYAHPQSGLHGVVAYIPAREIPEGRNLHRDAGAAERAPARRPERAVLHLLLALTPL